MCLPHPFPLFLLFFCMALCPCFSVGRSSVRSAVSLLSLGLSNSKSSASFCSLSLLSPCLSKSASACLCSAPRSSPSLPPHNLPLSLPVLRISSVSALLFHVPCLSISLRCHHCSLALSCVATFSPGTCSLVSYCTRPSLFSPDVLSALQLLASVFSWVFLSWNVVLLSALL